MNLATAAVASLAFGASVFGAARFANIVTVPLLYHAIVFGVFFGLYMVSPGGFAKNFNIPDKRPMGAGDIAYYTMVVHSTTGFGDMYPKTFWGRLVVCLHIGLVFLATAGLLPTLK